MGMTQDRGHRAPLAPGEIRTFTVGTQIFQVMHVAGGSLTQASVSGPRAVTRVLKTDVAAAVAVQAYADAIEQAESDFIDALDDADGTQSIGAGTGELIDPDAMPRPVADLVLDFIVEVCEIAENQQAGGDTYSAAATLALGMGTLAGMLAPYAEDMPKTVILMRNGNSLQVATSTNTAADIAGLMNAGTPKVYNAIDANDGLMHYISVAEIQDVYEIP